MPIVRVGMEKAEKHSLLFRDSLLVLWHTILKYTYTSCLSNVFLMMKFEFLIQSHRFGEVEILNIHNTASRIRQHLLKVL